MPKSKATLISRLVGFLGQIKPGHYRRMLESSAMGTLDFSIMNEVSRLKQLDEKRLALLGRLPYPMIRRHAQRGFSRISWKEAVDLIADAIHDIAPHQMGFFAAPHGLTNEVYYVFQKLARALGTNNVDLCSGTCSTASVSALRVTLGVGAPTCSLSDFIGTDLLVIFGSDLANEQAATMKYIRNAKQQRTRIVGVNPAREYGLERSWGASVISHGLFGTKLMDDFFSVRAGAEIAFINGTLKALIARNKLDEEFIAKHTTGFAKLKAALQEQSWQMIEERSGLSRQEIERFARLYASARTAVFVYDMSLTEREFGVNDVKAIVNLALARGMLGREKCGIMPLGGPSGIQGSNECGFEPDKFPGGFAVNDENARRFSNLWRHPVPSKPGLRAPQMIEAAHRRQLKFLYAIEGNLLAAMPDRKFVAEALTRIPLRIHQDFVLNSCMLLDAEQAVLILPGQTPYEQHGGGTTTSTERRIRFTPEIQRPRIGESLPEWEIPAIIGRNSMPNGDLLFPFQDTQSVREEMSRVMPIYKGVEKLKKEGDHLQWGGPCLYKEGFTSMPGNRAIFSVLDPG